jgi:hypothetical protein
VQHLSEAASMAASRAVAALPAADPAFNSTGIVTWIVKNLVPLLFAGIGILILAGAKKGRFSDNARIMSNLAIGCFVIAGAAVIYKFAGAFAGMTFGA